LVSESDRDRFASLDVVADFQLAPGSDDLVFKYFLANSGIGSVRRLSALELYQAGSAITLSNDWDEDVVSPIHCTQSS